MENYFIIHGTYGHNKENWFSWLENSLRLRGYDVFNFNYPTPDGQSFESWSKVLNKVKNKITSDSVFICHSICCVFLAKYIIENNIKIKKCIFVSGCNNYYFLENFDKINKSMYTNEIQKFVNLCKDRICIYSKDDPYIKFEALESFSNSIKAKALIYDHAGHFNEKAGYKTFEDLLKLI